MKKFKTAALSLCFAAALTLAPAALAESLPLLISPAPNALISPAPAENTERCLKVDGEILDLSALPCGLYEKDGVTMLPLRVTAEALGYTVIWSDTDGITVEGDPYILHVAIGYDIYSRSTAGQISLTAPFSLGAAPELLADGYTYVPAAAFETLGYEVVSDKSGVTISVKQEQAESVQIPNPIKNFDTLAEACEVAGFSAKVPSLLGEAERFTVIGNMVQVNYSDGVCYRTAPGVSDTGVRDTGVRDISGDYNSYSAETEQEIGNFRATFRGNGETVSLVVFDNGSESFSLSFETPVSTQTAADILSSVA